MGRVVGLGRSVSRTVINAAVSRRPVREVRVLSGSLRGARLRLDLRTEKAYWLGAYERELQQALVCHLGPGDVFWDVGAHIGFFSVLAKRLASDHGRVVAFEANPRIHDRLEWNLTANRGAPAILVGAAVSAEGGSASLTAGNTLFEASMRPREAGASIVSVPAITLDEATAEYPLPDLVKIDVEGAETDVVSGGKEMLVAKGPTLFLEVHAWAEVEGLWSMLKALGYGICGFDGAPADPAAARAAAGLAGATWVTARPL